DPPLTSSYLPLVASHRPAATNIYTLSLHDALPIFCLGQAQWDERALRMRQWQDQAAETQSCIDMLDRGGLERMFPAVQWGTEVRSEEHTSELQSRENLVCRLLLEKKNRSAHKRQTQ